MENNEVVAGPEFTPGHVPPVDETDDLQQDRNLVSLEEFTGELQRPPEPAKGTESIAQISLAETTGDDQSGGVYDYPEPIYSKADEPQEKPAIAEPVKQTPQEVKQQKFGKEFFATFAVNGVDMINARLCAFLSKSDDIDRWKLQEDEIKTLSEASTHYFESIDFQPSPLTVLIGAIIFIFGSRLGLAWMEGNEVKKRMKALHQNAPQVVGAIQQANQELQSEPKKRTDFRIYANGCYVKDRFGKERKIKDAEDKPNFEDVEEIKSVIKTNGLSKVKGAFPELAAVLEKDYAETA